MKGFFNLIVALLLVANLSNAQSNIAIRGVTENAAGKKIELFKISDQISLREMLTDSCRIGDDNKFNLRCYANYPTMVTLQIENYSQSFYVEPGKEYNIVIPRFDWNLDEKRNIFYDPEPLPLLFQNVAADDINLLIDSIDRVISSFIDKNYFYFDQKFKPSAYYFDSLVSVVNKICPDYEKDFVKRYKRFHLAELKYNMKFGSRKSLIDTYIKNSPILYYDDNYMSLFATLYGYSISKGTKDISVYRLANWVYNLDLNTYIDSIGVDPTLRHEQVRELAALQALQESYYNKYYNSEMVVKMIERIAQRTKFNEHKTIARNILDGLKSSGEDDKAPATAGFVLPDVDKNPVALDSFAGKWIYIAFVRVNDPESVSELETMAHFKDKVCGENDSVVFLTIDCDREFQKMFHFLKNTKHGNRFAWTWLHFDGNYDMLRHFQITSCPWFVLINPEGRVQYDITPAPSTGFLLNAPWKKNRSYDDVQREMFKY